ncbi:hypothetical protein TOPH_08332, partial [Tolypocladium ophioglossoides CBS 100239]
MIWDVSGDPDFATLSEKVSSLHAEIAVHRALELTAQNLQKPTPLPNAQSRLSKFIDAVYGSGDGKKEERLQKLRNFPHEGFIFVSISYTPLDITKMSRTEFECLIQTVPVYLRRRNLPQRWIFRDEIQVSLAGKASLKSAAEFRKGYYALEFQQQLEDQPPPAKCSRLEPSHGAAKQSGLIGDSEPDCDSRIVGEKPPNEESRRIVIQFLRADVGKLDDVLSGGPLLKAVKSSRQWRWERDQDIATDVPRTDCLIAMIPDSYQDISIMIRAGYQEGRAIAAALGFQRSDVL